MESESGVQEGGSRRALSRLEEGIALAHRGEKMEARALFREIIHSTPENEEAWLWLAWLSEDRRESRRLLIEAQAFLPDSARIAEALRWVDAEGMEQEKQGEEQPKTRPEESQAPKPTPRSDIIEQLGAAVQKARDGIVRTVEGVATAVSDMRMPRFAWLCPLRRINYVAILKTGAFVVILVFLLLLVQLGIANARKSTVALQPIQLPTLAPDATATPTLEQLCEPLWVQAKVAFTREDWGGAIESLRELLRLEPKNDDAQAMLAEALRNRGQQLIANNSLEEARILLDEAIRLHASDGLLQDLRRILKYYMDGLEAYLQHEWNRAVEKLERVHEQDPNFRDTTVMLGEAYYQKGLERMTVEAWLEARDCFERVLELLPDHQAAKTQLAEVMDILIPPRRIEVDLSDKITVVYENHQPIYRFLVCTGRPSAPTLPGRYQVLDKLPMAYASKWDLDMPWWLGIYWAGGSENGFHALPILSNGRILWRGALGTGCSFGCIVLDTDDAITLYNWARIGDVVLVNP